METSSSVPSNSMSNNSVGNQSNYGGEQSASIKEDLRSRLESFEDQVSDKLSDAVDKIGQDIQNTSSHWSKNAQDVGDEVAQAIKQFVKELSQDSKEAAGVLESIGNIQTIVKDNPLRALGVSIFLGMAAKSLWSGNKN